MNNTAKWKARIWDKPSNGTRFSVERDNRWTVAGMDIVEDARGGVLTFPSREKAQQHADWLNEGYHD